MAQYQTFPGAEGASRTTEKLLALKLPDLVGKSFLDVGCNEGFFCGFASFMGASRVVGIDHSQLFVERAAARFPDCEFLLQGWDRLPDGEFDVILLASALHYAEDQPALLRKLVDKLSADGVLVVELGVFSSRESTWTEVARGIDRRSFPSMAKLKEILSEYAWKWMGPSVMQQGDPVPRHVLHISRRKPVAYLLMQPPGYGKTSIATRLFADAEVNVVSGDEVLNRIAKGLQVAEPALKRIVDEDFSPFRIDRLASRLFEEGETGEQLLRLCADAAGAADFALDMYIPAEHHAKAEKIFAALGYLPIILQWERAGPPAYSADMLAERVKAFRDAMLASPVKGLLPLKDFRHQPAQGFVDEVAFDGSRLVVRGWAINRAGETPPHLEIELRGSRVSTATLERQSRPDVQRQLGLPHDLVGYRFSQEVPQVSSLADLDGNFGLRIPGEGLLRMNRRVLNALSKCRKTRGDDGSA